MKTSFISLCAFILLLAGCTIFKNTAQNGKMQIINAGYNNWSEPPLNGGDVPERGTDLAVIVKNWPQGAMPDYIVYQNRKSLHPRLSDTTDIGVVINARIIRASSVLTQTSEKVDVSDRLVYTDTEGEMQFIEIEEWKRIDRWIQP